MKQMKILLVPLIFLLLFSCDLSLDERKPTIRIITVASDYIGIEAGDLECCINDQKAMKEQLEHLSLHSGYEFDGIHITYSNGEIYSIRSTNDSSSEFQKRITSPYSDLSRKPMRETIEAAFDALSKGSNDEDITIFYYTGHGAHGNEYPWLERGTLFFENNSEDGIHVHELYEMLSQINGKKLLLIDSCYSGAFVYDDIHMPGTLKDALNLLFVTPGFGNDDIWMLSASSEDEESKTGHTYSLFTDSLLEALGYDTENGAVGFPESDDVYFSEIYDYVKANTDTIQHPQSERTIRDMRLFSIITRSLRSYRD